jgi:hypothetical protein
MKTKILILAAVAMFTINTTASFGQAPKTDRQTVQTTASNKRHELRHKKKQRTLFPHLKQGNSKSFRAPQATALLLDSVVIQINPAVLEEGESEKGKIVQSYNAAGDVILKIFYEWDATITRTWKEIGRDVYDDKGNLILSTYSGTDDRGNEWSEKDEYAYDHLNWIILDASFSWENGQLRQAYRTVYEYTDLADKYIESKTQYNTWNSADLQITGKEEYTYAGQRQFGEGPNNYVPMNSSYPLPSLPSEDKEGNVLAHASYQYNYVNIASGSKTEYTKDANGNITLETYYSWDITTNQWEEDWKRQIEYAYNSAGYLTAKTYRDWDYEAGAWSAEAETYAYTYDLDSKNNVLSFTTEAEQVDFTYDTQNRAITAVVYNRYEDRLEKVTSYERDFDSHGNTILYSRSEWSEGIVAHHSKEEWAYDATGREMMNSYLYGSSDNGEIFYRGSKSEYAYDANGNKIRTTMYNYNSESKTFIYSYKDEYSYGNQKWFAPYDNEDNDFSYIPLNEKHSYWDEESDKWVVMEEGQYDWTFDSAGNPTTMSMNLKEGDGPPIWYGTMTFYYSQHTVSGIADVPATVAPHVWISNGVLHIENGDASVAQVFDISGRAIVSGNLSGGQALDVSHLPKGVYLVRINGKTVKTTKN